MTWTRYVPVLAFHVGQRPVTTSYSDNTAVRLDRQHYLQTSTSFVSSKTTSQHRSCVTTRLYAETSIQQDTSLSISEATQILQQFEAEQSQFAKEENIGMGGGVSASMYATTLSEEALEEMGKAARFIVAQANQEREEDYTAGRVKLGICAEDCMEALGTLKVRDTVRSVHVMIYEIKKKLIILLERCCSKVKSS